MTLSICQVANSLDYSRKRHAKGSRPARVGAPGACDVSTNDLSFIAIRIATRAAAQAANEPAVE
jgi:hypothetical protein